jgi:hypothetical protein
MPGKIAWGFSLFCDDIRGEIGGKLSVMGIYQSDMIFPPTQTFPFNMPKFCVLIKYYENLNTFTDDIAIRVFLPGDASDSPTVVLPFPRASLGQPDFSYALEEDQERIFNLSFPLVLSPCLIKQEGFIKVRAICGTTTTRLGSLRIRKAQADENLQWFMPPQVPTNIPAQPNA